MLLEGRSTVITGAGSGVGRASARLFTEEGAGERLGTYHPLGRPMSAEDCAAAAVYLASDPAVNVTGVLLPVDGGYTPR